MSFGFRAEAGYDSAKDATFLRTNSTDFDSQLTVPLTRGSDEDKQVRTLLEEQGVIDFDTLNKDVKYSDSPQENTPFGLLGGDIENDELTVENFPHAVVFGKEGSGVKNLIRSWIMSSASEERTIITFDITRDIYDMADYLDAHDASVYHFEESIDSSKLLRVLNDFDAPLLIVGPDSNMDSRSMKLVFNFLNESDSSDIRILIHNERMLKEDDSKYMGKALNSAQVITVGDVTEATVKLVGENATARNKRGWLWLSTPLLGAVRVKSYIVPKSMIMEAPVFNSATVVDYLRLINPNRLPLSAWTAKAPVNQDLAARYPHFLDEYSQD